MERTIDKIEAALVVDRSPVTYHWEARKHLLREIKKAIKEEVDEAILSTTCVRSR